LDIAGLLDTINSGIVKKYLAINSNAKTCLGSIFQEKMPVGAMNWHVPGKFSLPHVIKR
jgi:hypothetical protein